MSKKSSKLNLFYLIGMIAVVVGSFLPIITLKLGPLGSVNFTLVKAFGNLDSSSSWFALLMFAAAVVGVVFCFVGNKNSAMIKLVALVATVVFGLIFFANAGFFKSWFKVTGIGFYVILAGWIVAAIGQFLKK